MIDARALVGDVPHPSIDHALMRATHEIRMRFHHILHQQGTHLRCDIIVRINKNQPFALCSLYTCPSCGILPLVFLMNKMDSLVISAKSLTQCRRSVRRSVIHQPKFNFWIRLFLDAGDAFFEIRFFIVNWDNDADRSIHFISPLVSCISRVSYIPTKLHPWKNAPHILETGKYPWMLDFPVSLGQTNTCQPTLFVPQVQASSAHTHAHDALWRRYRQSGLSSPATSAEPARPARHPP